VQQRQDSHQRFVRMDRRVGCPATEQVSLLFQGQCLASEASRRIPGQPSGRVNEDYPLTPGESEELAK
jgi:hypothetical protein